MSIADAVKESRGAVTSNLSSIGDHVEGAVVSSVMRQARVFGPDSKPTDELDTWKDGSPKMQAYIVVSTGLTDPGIEDDNGERGIYIKAWGGPWKALLAALRVAEDDDVRPGGFFSATLVGLDSATSPATKIFAYVYRKPGEPGGLGAAVAAAQSIAAPAVPAAPPISQAPSQGAPIVPPVAQYAAPGVVAPAPPAPAAVPVAPIDPAAALAKATEARGLISFGLTDQQISAHLGIPVEAVAALRAVGV